MRGRIPADGTELVAECLVAHVRFEFRGAIERHVSRRRGEPLPVWQSSEPRLARAGANRNGQVTPGGAPGGVAGQVQDQSTHRPFHPDRQHEQPLTQGRH